MKRDFSESTKEELLSLVGQVESEQWCDFTDWVGDKWYDFEGWIGALDVKKYLDNVNTYHKKVIDKNNTTIDDINKIFENVNGVSTQYFSRFTSLTANLQQYRKMIGLLALVVDPSNGSFESTLSGLGLKNAMNRYIENSKNLQTMAEDGLTQEDVENMDEAKLQSLLDTYVAVILNNIPNGKIGDELEVPIGSGVRVYYKIEGEVKGTGDIDLSYVIEDQKLKLEEFEYSHDFGGGVTGKIDNEGKVSVETSGENMPTIEMSGEGFSVSYENTVGANTYKYSYEANFFEQELKMEESVTTDLNSGSVTSTIGIKFSDDDNIRWEPVPVPVPVESPYTCQIPDFDIDWETVGTVVVIAGTTFYVVKKLAGIVLVPYTGGASLVLTAT